MTIDEIKSAICKDFVDNHLREWVRRVVSSVIKTHKTLPKNYIHTWEHSIKSSNQKYYLTVASRSNCYRKKIIFYSVCAEFIIETKHRPITCYLILPQELLFNEIPVEVWRETHTFPMMSFSTHSLSRWESRSGSGQDSTPFRSFSELTRDNTCYILLYLNENEGAYAINDGILYFRVINEKLYYMTTFVSENMLDEDQLEAFNTLKEIFESEKKNNKNGSTVSSFIERVMMNEKYIKLREIAKDLFSKTSRVKKREKRIGI